MFFLKTEASFDAAHFLEGYDGKCRNIHGHRWRVIAQIKGKRLDEEKQTRGMLVDFGVLKDSLKLLCKKLDHCLIYEKDSLKPLTIEAFRQENFKIFEVPFRPTAENFAYYFYKKLEQQGFDVARVEVYETPNNCAAYEE